MFYPTCCKAAFSLVSCKTGLRDGAYMSYLNEDLDQPCWNDTHISAVIMIGIPTLIVWVIGIPVFIFVVLESHRKQKHNDIIRFRYGMLMEGYEGKKKEQVQVWSILVLTNITHSSMFIFLIFKSLDEYFYWESVIASRKMLVIGVSVFMSSFTVDIQAYVGIAIVILFMTMHISSNPYNSAVLDSMEKYALATAFATLYVGLLFYIAKEDNVDQSMLVLIGSLFIVGVNVIYLCYAVFEILIFYASANQGCAKKTMVRMEPVLKVLCCRSKETSKRHRKLLHKRTIKKVAALKKLDKMNQLKKSNNSKVTPIRSTDAPESPDLRTWGNKGD